MGLIHEETENSLFPMEITVSERLPGETREPWKIICLNWDSFTSLSPLELRQLGRWMMKESLRIGREYKSNGAPK